MARLTISELRDQLTYKDAQLQQLQAELDSARTRLIQRDAALRLMRTIVADALSPSYEQTDAAIDDPPA